MRPEPLLQEQLGEAVELVEDAAEDVVPFRQPGPEREVAFRMAPQDVREGLKRTRDPLDAGPGDPPRDPEERERDEDPHPPAASRRQEQDERDRTTAGSAHRSAKRLDAAVVAELHHVPVIPSFCIRR